MSTFGNTRTTKRGTISTLPEVMTRGSDKKQGFSNRFFTAALFVLFLLTLLVGLWVGTTVYGNLNDMQTTTSEEHLSLNLLANTVRSNDATDAVGVGKGPEGKALVLTQKLSTGSYETRFYLHDGYIVQEFSVASTPYTPDAATKVAPASTFDFSYSRGLLTIFTDQGDVKVALRSVRGGA